MQLDPRGAAVSLAKVAATTARNRVRHLRERRRDRTYSYAGRVVVLATGARGLGAALARRFAGEDARLALVGTGADELAALRDDLYRAGTDVVTIAGDPTDEQGARGAVAETVARFGSIDVLVNGSGRLDAGSIDRASTGSFSRAMAAHFFAPLHLMQAVLPIMRQRGSGRIVNIGSLAAFTSLPQLLPYASSKAALVGLSRGLCAELAGEGICVTTVYPGLIRYRGARRLWKARRIGDLWRMVADALPLLSIDPERAADEIVEACRLGRSQVVLSWPAKLATFASAVTPELVGAVLASLYWRARAADPRRHSLNR